MPPALLANEVYTSTMTGLILAGPILGVAAGLGLLLGLLQAITQIQDQALPQIAKIAIISIIVLVMGAQLSGPMYDHADRLFTNFPNMVR